MRGDWLSRGVSWGENREQGEGDLRDRWEWGQQRIRVRRCHQGGTSIFNTQRFSLEFGRPWGILGTEEYLERWQKRDRGAWEGQFSWGCRSPTDLGEGFGSQRSQGRDQILQCIGEEKGEAASGIFRLGGRCL